MRTLLKALLTAGFCTMPLAGAVPGASAAELAVTPVKKASVRVIHHRKRIVHYRSPVVRDYDGAAVVQRRYRTVAVHNFDGTIIVKPEYELVPVKGGMPTRYLNGEPVLPAYPRSWPQVVRSYHLRIGVRPYPG